MTASRFLYPAIGLATVLIVGLASSVWFLLHRVDNASRTDRILACLTQVGRRNPIEDAGADFARGERRFLLMSHNGVVETAVAEGVCEAKDFELGRTLPFRDSNILEVFSVKGNFCCDRDPPKTPCGEAITSYYQAYNREMARLSPQSIKAYCKNGKSYFHA